MSRTEKCSEISVSMSSCPKLHESIMYLWNSGCKLSSGSWSFVLRYVLLSPPKHFSQTSLLSPFPFRLLSLTILLSFVSCVCSLSPIRLHDDGHAHHHHHHHHPDANKRTTAATQTNTQTSIDTHKNTTTKKKSRQTQQEHDSCTYAYTRKRWNTHTTRSEKSRISQRKTNTQTQRHRDTRKNNSQTQSVTNAHVHRFTFIALANSTPAHMVNCLAHVSTRVERKHAVFQQMSKTQCHTSASRINTWTHINNDHERIHVRWKTAQCRMQTCTVENGKANEQWLAFFWSCLMLLSTYHSTLLYFTLLYSTLLYSTLLYSTLLYSTLLYSTPLYSTPRQATLGYAGLGRALSTFYSLQSSLLCSTLLDSTLLYCTLLYSALLYFPTRFFRQPSLK